MMSFAKFMESAGGRKLSVALVLFIASTTLLAVGIGDVDFTKWADFMKWIFGLYMAGNVGSATATAVAKKNGNGNGK